MKMVVWVIHWQLNLIKKKKKNWFIIGKRVWQGCILSPCLFNLYAEYIIWNARLDESQADIKIAGRNINNFRYADAAAAAKSSQLCLTLCNPIDGSPPGSPVPGILQGRTLEWVAISFSNAWKWKVKEVDAASNSRKWREFKEPLDEDERGVWKKLA